MRNPSTDIKCRTICVFVRTISFSFKIHKLSGCELLAAFRGSKEEESIMEGAASIELYGMRTGNCFRAAMALEEAGIPYLARWYDPRHPGGGEASYLRLNPTGKVPTLVDHGAAGGPFVLTQSNAIVLYAGEKAPDQLFSEDGLTGRARVFERFFYFVTDVIAPSHAAFYLRSQNEPRAVNLLTERSLTAIENAERFLSVGPFMAGDSFSIADIAAFTIVSATKDELPWSRLSALERWFSVIQERPAIKRGTAAFNAPG
jgi:GSH-dependent disulfide-bond oxidoreductase